jgi:hypothetical protein
VFDPPDQVRLESSQVCVFRLAFPEDANAHVAISDK